MPRKPTGQLIERKNGWYARYLATVDGVRKHVCVDLDTRNELLARQRLDKLLAADRAGNAPSMVETFEQAAERVHAVRVRTKPSARGEISLLRVWAFQAIGSMAPHEVTRADVDAVLVAARDAGKAHQTIIHIRNATAAVFKELKREGVVADMPVPAIADLPEALPEAMARSEKPKAILSEAEFLAYLRYTDPRDALRFRGPARERQMMTLLSLAGGLRTGELHGLTWSRARAEEGAFDALEVIRYKARRKAARAGSKAAVRQLYTLGETVLPMFLRFWWLRSHRPALDALLFPVRRAVCPLRTASVTLAA